MEINEEKREKFMSYAGKRVNNILHDIQILEPMSRSNAYSFTKEDVAEMFGAIQETLDNAKYEFEKVFEKKEKSEKKVFSFGSSNTENIIDTSVNNNVQANDSETIARTFDN